MHRLLLSVTLLMASLVQAQTGNFPKSFIGKWKGELQWYKNGKAEPQKVMMEMNVQATEKPDRFNWQIIYGDAGKDNRPYTLVAQDSTGAHWVIDENNGIVLDQYWLGNRFSGAFSVAGNTIVNSYWIEGGQLHVEFFSYPVKATSITGKGTEESPSVDVYRIGGYQKAVLVRQ